MSSPPPKKSSSPFPSLSAALLLPLLPACYFQWHRVSNLWAESNITTHIPFLSTPTPSGGLQDPPSQQTQLAAQYAAGCPDHNARVNIFSQDPLIIYVEEYLRTEEIAYLLNLAVPHYEQSPVSKGYNLRAYDAEIRSSMSAVLPLDPVVRCIEQRSVDFQGFMPRNRLEDIQVVKYGIGDHFRPHFDWFGGMSNPRVSTFFVYLACDGGEIGDGHECVGGATQFPHYEGTFPAKWCEFIDCKDDSGVGGVAFKPIVGNAVFWQNLYPNGTGHPGVWHAGMPVKEGRKVGLNIFTRQNEVVDTE